MSEYIQYFFIGGSILTGLSYIANEIDPVLAGLLGGIPIALPTLYTITGKKRISKYIDNLVVSTFLLFFVTLIFYICNQQYKYKKNNCLCTSLLVWFLTIYYLWKKSVNKI